MNEGNSSGLMLELWRKLQDPQFGKDQPVGRVKHVTLHLSNPHSHLAPAVGGKHLLTGLPFYLALDLLFVILTLGHSTVPTA